MENNKFLCDPIAPHSTLWPNLSNGLDFFLERYNSILENPSLFSDEKKNSSASTIMKFLDLATECGSYLIHHCSVLEVCV